MKLPTVSPSKQQQQQEVPSSMLRVAAWAAAAAVFLALFVYALSSSDGTAITYILCSQLPGTAGSGSSSSSSDTSGQIPTFGWNPMQLPLEYHEWIHDQVGASFLHLHPHCQAWAPFLATVIFYCFHAAACCYSTIIRTSCLPLLLE